MSRWLGKGGGLIDRSPGDAGGGGITYRTKVWRESRDKGGAVVGVIELAGGVRVQGGRVCGNTLFYRGRRI